MKITSVILILIYSCNIFGGAVVCDTGISESQYSGNRAAVQNDTMPYVNDQPLQESNKDNNGRKILKTSIVCAGIATIVGLFIGIGYVLKYVNDHDILGRMAM
jgi:hypothetical protein